ncbi:MAG: efflux RND transporter permease subunit [Halothiobacillaceae bacterium]|nr:efflux RND transporter permease subunit [Halothiobacillaceae bacterium]
MMRFNLSAWAVRERAVILYFLLMAALGGLYAFSQLGRAEDPSFTVKVMTASAIWPGATARQMQEQVADRLEKRLQEIRYFDKVITTARPGRVDLLIEFAQEASSGEIDDLFYEVRKRLGEEAARLPEGVQGPFFNDDFSDVYFTLYALSAPGLPPRLLAREAERVRDALLRVEGVQKANIVGELPSRIYIELSSERLSTLGISAEQVFDALAKQNALAPGGLVEAQGPRVYLRLPGDFDSLDVIRAVPISVGGRQLRLSDLGEVRRGYEDPPSFIVRNRGEPAVLVGVVMRSGQNGLELGKRLSVFEAEANAGLPLGMRLSKITDQADAIRSAIETFEGKFVVALVVVAAVGFVALGLRAGAVVALAVPLTLGITFLIMLMTGKNLDRITLGALILALGLLVDDAIIAIEMMLVKMEEGMDRIHAAAYAWQVTAAPMLVGTLLTAIGFVPIGFARSNVGEYAGNIFWVLAVALCVSWFVALVFSPYLGVKFLPQVQVRSAAHGGGYNTRIYRALRRMVVFCVHHRYLVVALTFGLLVVSAMGMKLKVEQQFFPSSDRPELLIDIRLPEGSAIEATRRVAERVEQAVMALPETRQVHVYVGQGAPRFFLALNPELPNPAFAKVIAIAADAHGRDVLKARLQALIDEGQFPEARVRVHLLLYGPPVEWPVSFRVVGDDPLTLRRIAGEVREIMAAHPNIHDPNLEWNERVPVLRFNVDLDRLSQLGFTPASVSRQLQFLLGGVEVTQVREDIRTVQLIARAPQEERLALGELDNRVVRNATGQNVPLSQLGQWVVDYEEPVLKRRNREQYLAVNAEITGKAQPPDVTFALWPKLQQIQLPAGYRIDIGGSVEESAKAQDSINRNMPIMVLLMLTLIMLYVRSFPPLFMVLFTAPLGLIGAVGALLLFQQPFGFVALLGLIGLGGILMRNTLILVGQFQENLHHGMTAYQAIVEATLRRARPVVLTALAAIMAFIPLTQSTFWGPLAYVLIGGVSSGTLVTLLFLPAMVALGYRIPRHAGG